MKTTSSEETDNAKKNQELREGVASGLRWTGVSQALQQVINLAWSVVMARLLLPEDFGLLAMASVFTGLVYFVLDLGLSVAVVQREDLEERHLSSIFWLNLGTGMVLTLIGFTLSWPIAAFYRNPEVQPVVALLSCNFLLFSLSITQSALLSRRMDFRSLEMRKLAGLVIASGCSIAMAVWGFGALSLVMRYLIDSAVGAVLLWSVCGWRPRWYFRWSHVREFFGFSSQVLVANLIGHVGRNADNLLIGRFVGAAGLGFYSLAYNLMMFPVLRFTQVLISVLFPALSRMQEDAEKLARTWFRVARLITAITAPLMVGLIVLTEPFVQMVYGSKWLPAVPLLRILAVLGIVQSLALLDTIVLISLGQTQLRLKLVSLGVGVAIVAFLIGLAWGTVGVASCFVIACLLTSAYALYKTLSFLELSIGDYLSNLAGVITAALGMGGALLAVQVWLPVHSAGMLLATIAYGAAAYLLLLRWITPAVLTEFLSVLPDRLTRHLPLAGLR